jgi:hypothetical protein
MILVPTTLAQINFSLGFHIIEKKINLALPHVGG